MNESPTAKTKDLSSAKIERLLDLKDRAENMRREEERSRDNMLLAVSSLLGGALLNLTMTKGRSLIELELVKFGMLSLFSCSALIVISYLISSHHYKKNEESIKDKANKVIDKINFKLPLLESLQRTILVLYSSLFILGLLFSLIFIYEVLK